MDRALIAWAIDDLLSGETAHWVEPRQARKGATVDTWERAFREAEARNAHALVRIRIVYRNREPTSSH